MPGYIRHMIGRKRFYRPPGDTIEYFLAEGIGGTSNDAYWPLNDGSLASWGVEELWGGSDQNKLEWAGPEGYVTDVVLPGGYKSGGSQYSFRKYQPGSGGYSHSLGYTNAGLAAGTARTFGGFVKWADNGFTGTITSQTTNIGIWRGGWQGMSTWGQDNVDASGETDFHLTNESSTRLKTHTLLESSMDKWDSFAWTTVDAGGGNYTKSFYYRGALVHSWTDSYAMLCLNDRFNISFYIANSPTSAGYRNYWFSDIYYLHDVALGTAELSYLQNRFTDNPL